MASDKARQLGERPATAFYCEHLSDPGMTIRQRMAMEFTASILGARATDVRLGVNLNAQVGLQQADALLEELAKE